VITWGRDQRPDHTFALSAIQVAERKKAFDWLTLRVSLVLTGVGDHPAQIVVSTNLAGARLTTADRALPDEDAADVHPIKVRPRRHPDHVGR